MGVGKLGPKFGVFGVCGRYLYARAREWSLSNKNLGDIPPILLEMTIK
jgi:hypothetical protein